jgi:hypothetical protein
LAFQGTRAPIASAQPGVDTPAPTPAEVKAADVLPGIDQNDDAEPRRSADVTLPDGNGFVVRAIDTTQTTSGSGRTRLLLTEGGGIGVANDGDSDALIGAGKALQFLFPRDSPAVLLEIVLSEFDGGDESVMLTFDRVAAADAPRRRRRALGERRRREASGELLLVDVVTETGDVTRDGYTSYTLTPMGATTFGVKSMRIDSSAPTVRSYIF